MEMIRRVRDDGEWKEVALIDGLMNKIVQKGMGVTEMNRLLYAAGMVVAERQGLKTQKSKKAEQKKPFWKLRIEESIKKWRKDLSQVEEIRRAGSEHVFEGED